MEISDEREERGQRERPTGPLSFPSSCWAALLPPPGTTLPGDTTPLPSAEDADGTPRLQAAEVSISLSVSFNPVHTCDPRT